MKSFILVCVTTALACHSVAAAEFPQAKISNSAIHAKLYLPDARQGYYRGTRFDWSGVVARLGWNGHSYFQEWVEKHDPKLHDSISGPVEEFLTGDAALGYEEAKPGELFVKIGVGALRKPNEPSYSSFTAYEIVNSGKWATKKGSDWIEFVHEFPDTSGYAYIYRKKVRLEKGKPLLVLEHALRNTGRKVIETSVYNHNFFIIDGQPSGPDFVVKFPFDLHATQDLKGLAETRGKELVYLQELPKGQSVYTRLEGFGTSVADYDIRVENHKTGAGVRQFGDHPLSKLAFWSNPKLVCPEPFVNMRIEPGKESTWRISYEFYTVPTR